MSGPGRQRQWHLLLNLYSLFLIPAYTILFAGKVTWFRTNFSVIAVMGHDQYRGFIYWGILVGLYFMVLMLRIAWTIPHGWVAAVLTVMACASLFCALILPYMPEYFPKIADLHIMLAALACVILMLCLLFVLALCCRENKRRYLPLLGVWAAIALISGVLFVMAGIISSALEMFFVISTTLLLRKLWLYRCDSLPGQASAK